MKLLLDTHVILWAIGNPSRLSPRARQAITDTANDLYLSAASIWEIQLKRRAGKLALPDAPAYLPDHIRRVGVREVIPITPDHAYRVLSVSPVHKDPFDCLLAAQCQAENLTIVTADDAFTKLGVPALW